MTIRGVCLSLLNNWATARPIFIAISAVIGALFATPRTPSVPKSFPMRFPYSFLTTFIFPALQAAGTVNGRSCLSFVAGVK
jgi:hypothetical protein